MSTSVHVLKQKELELQAVKAELAEALYRLDRSHFEAYKQELDRADIAEGELAVARARLVACEHALSVLGDVLAMAEAVRGAPSQYVHDVVGRIEVAARDALDSDSETPG